MPIDRPITYRFNRNDTDRPIARTVGDALGALVVLLGGGARVAQHSCAQIVLAETDPDGQVVTMAFEGDIGVMEPLFEATRWFLLAQVYAEHAPIESEAATGDSRSPALHTRPDLVGLAHAIGMGGDEVTAALMRMSGAELALLVRFHVDLGIPMAELLGEMRRDPETVRNLTGDWIDKAALDAVSELVDGERPNACPIALARELRAGVRLEPRAFGWSA